MLRNGIDGNDITISFTHFFSFSFLQSVPVLYIFNTCICQATLQTSPKDWGNMDVMWRNPHKSEITCGGHYIMFRTDDNCFEQNKSEMALLVVEILEGVKHFFVKMSDTEIQNVHTFDEQVRFFGPLDSNNLEMIQNLSDGLSGKMG